MPRIQTRVFNISVEGINCEKLYFEHLAKLINKYDKRLYNLKVSPKVKSPYEYAKSNSYKPSDSFKGKKLPYIHVQDIEDYYDEKQRQRFYDTITEMRKAEKDFQIQYRLGYSNYTFELWMLLHVAEMQYSISNRTSYLKPINHWFHKKFKKIDDFKKEDEFQDVLDHFVTLESVFMAIERAKSIVSSNHIDENKVKEEYKGFLFFHDNPDLTVHEIVSLILDACGVNRNK